MNSAAESPPYEIRTRQHEVTQKSLSTNNALALIANGCVYTRWYGWAIIPRNVLGASCSFFTGITGAVQFARRQHYEMYIQGTPDDPLFLER